MRLSIISVLVLSLVISGCSFAPDYKRPDNDLASGFAKQHLDGESAANIKWWELFKDDKLQTLIKEALANNKNLALSLARIEESRALVSFTRADQFPRIDLNASAGRGDLGQNFVAENHFSISGDLSWELDFWGKFRNATEAQRALLLTSEYAHRTLVLSLVSRVAELYYALVDLDWRLGIGQRTLKNRVDGRKIIDARLSKGIVPELDLNQAQIEEYEVGATITSLERQSKFAEHALLILLGRSNGKIERVSTLSSALMETQIPTGVPAALLERRPDLLGLEESIQAELYLEGVAQAQRLPTIDILGSIGLTSRTDSNFFSSSAHSWAVGGGLFSPLIDWGKNISRVEAQQARVDQAKYSYENAVLSAVSEVEDALSEIDTYKREHDRRVLQIKAATNADKLSRARYNDGVTAYIEVLDVERSLFSAELNASLAYRNYLSSLVRLYKALGGGWTE